MIEKTFLNPATNKQWRIEIDGHTIRTCLNGGKVKEILCDSAFQVRSKAASAMMGQMRKGFVYQNRDAAVGQARCHRFVGKDSNGFMPLAASPARDDFFLTRVVGDFEDETLYHFDGSGESLETVSLGAKRMTYEQVLCSNDTLLLNNSYLLQQFSLRTHEVTPFANKKNSMKTMLDVSGDLALWYTGEEIVVFAFGSNTKVWRETVKCKKSKDPNFAYYCFGMLSPRQSKAVYRVTEGEYVLVDLKSAQKVVIPNAGWHPFFSPDDQCFSVGGRFYLTQTGEEIANPFPFSVRQGLNFSDTCMVRTRGSLMAVQQDRGSSPIELWDTGSGQLLASIDFWDQPRTAMHSISSFAPLGMAATCTQLRTGNGSAKALAYSAFTAAKSLMSARKITVLTTLAMVRPASARIALRFARLCAACSSTVSAILPVAGSTGI